MNRDMSFPKHGPLADREARRARRAARRLKRKNRKEAKNQTNESVAENRANAPKNNNAAEKTTYIYNRKKEMGLI